MSDARLRRIWSRYRQLLITQVLIHISLFKTLEMSSLTSFSKSVIFEKISQKMQSLTKSRHQIAFWLPASQQAPLKTEGWCRV